MSYVFPKVETVSKEEFRAGLLGLADSEFSSGLVSLVGIPTNKRLEAKMLVWSTKDPSVASSLFDYRQTLLNLEDSVWLDVVLVEETVEFFAKLLNNQISVAILKAYFSESMRLPGTFNTAVMRVSVPWIFWTLIKDKQIAERLVETHDVELGFTKSWS